MSTLTKIATRPITMVELNLTFELDQEKVIILEEGLLYKVKYIVPINHGDSTTPIRELVGRLSKIIQTEEKGFNPFYHGTVYNLIFDSSEDFHAVEIKLSTAQIRDIDIYVINDQEEENKDENEDSGNDGTNDENSGELNPDDTGSGNDGTQSGDDSENQGSTGENDGSNESDGNGDSQPSEPEIEEGISSDPDVNGDNTTEPEEEETPTE